MNITKQSTASVDETRRNMIYKLLEERYKYKEVPKYYIEQEVESYLQTLDEGNALLTTRLQTDLTSAEDINLEMLESEIDIHTIYGQLEHVEDQMNQHQTLNNSIINDVQARVYKADERMAEISWQLREEAVHIAYYDSFLDLGNTELDDKFYTDRDGVQVGPGLYSVLDTNHNVLKLPMVYTENQLINFAGVKLAEVKINKQLGGGMVRRRNPEHSPEMMIDESMNTYWNEIISMDEPLRVNMGADYYNKNFGALCEMEIVFDYVSNLNEITFTPFTEFPLEVVAILTYTTDNPDEQPYELISPTNIKKGQESADVMSFQFQNIVAKRMKIILNQQHYVKRDVLIDVDDKTLTDAWLDVQSKPKITPETIFKPVYEDQFEMNPQWEYMKRYLSGKDIAEEIQKYEDADATNKMQVSKYEYQYGLYNLAIHKNNYYHTGINVTRPLAHANVRYVSLEAKEEHPLLEEIAIPVTGVEYYITDTENPTAEDWIPILPKNIKRIGSERLFVKFEKEQYQAMTLFSSKHTYAVRKNGGDLLPIKEYTVSGRNVVIENYDPTAIYTIDYEPDASAYEVDFLKKYTKTELIPNEHKIIQFVDPRKSIEEFKEFQNGNVVQLKYHPFIDKDKLNVQPIDWNPSMLSSKYVPIIVRVTLPNGKLVQQRVDKWDKTDMVLVNRTDYFDPNKSLLEPFNGRNYQYRIENDMIKFNTSLPAGTKVTVEYPYLTGPIRLKTILRRNLQDAEGLTPLLHEYKIGLQTLR